MAAVKFSDQEIKAAKNDLLKPTNDSGWLLMGYTSPDTVGLQATGKGGVTELVGKLKDNEVQFCLIRLLEVEKDISKVNRQDGKAATKDIFITWIGPEVRQVEKGKKTSHAGTVAKFMQPFHAELMAVNKENFTETVVREKAAPLSGSHVID